MTQEERDICRFMKATPEVYYSAREIARCAGRRDMRHQPPDWIIEHLQRLVRRGVMETDNTGHYRLKVQPAIQADGRKWVSPHIANLLKKSTTDFSGVATTEITEDGMDDVGL
ncbi:MAG: hypothetical protein NTZ16_06130 [Verrucomicrobia bacterium]|nr:hypothetical protein [Verrucomicrobiota bacterium]